MPSYGTSCKVFIMEALCTNHGKTCEVQIMHAEKQKREEGIILNFPFLLPIAILGIIKYFYHVYVNAISFLVLGTGGII